MYKRTIPHWTYRPNREPRTVDHEVLDGRVFFPFHGELWPNSERDNLRHL